ncbi:glycoside hydrolase family 95 protein [Paxillus involutus ATCC 200175]|uniref:Unplaced genomic scaffold PAXINscaffold_38, whole genome shotgun sequence n=1 Tax=Paxillus involutus ATCC 200175 TaxID=664439 RepID=A0A0C9SUJ4_PAXIN|nr:glycoside hydrolase family 95 protein [Paxillus involutus ATCC 200175]
MDSPIGLLGGRPWAFLLPVFQFLSRFLPWSMQMLLGRLYCLSTAANCVSHTHSAPPGFPSSGNGLWYTTPGSVWVQELLPIGNGYLAAMLPGGTSQESTQLNIESLWSGGPFQDPTYSGGNSLPSQHTQLAEDMRSIRQNIFSSPTGTIDSIEEIMTDAGAYGYLLATLDISGQVTNYWRWLDLDEAVSRTTWSQGGATFYRETFCSHPLEACLQYVNTTAKILPSLSYAYSVSAETGLPTPNVTCFDNSTLSIRNYVNNPGVMYEILAQVVAPGGSVACSTVPRSNSPNATLSVTGASEAWITWVGGTNYDMTAGTTASNYSFQGSDPHDALVTIMSSTNSGSKSYSSILAQHIADYDSIVGSFSLSLGQVPDLDTPTDQIVASYQTYVGNAYLEWLLFNYGRYLLTSSARGILPVNLQGKWADGLSNAWGAGECHDLSPLSRVFDDSYGKDYHSNINIQMNYWFAEMTNMDVVLPLFDYFENTWAPRGAYTAWALYNISSGWVTHNEFIQMNIFGHTGMKLSGNSAQWANYPESNAWMMIHAWDHFDYTNDVQWWQTQGWPLVKSVASFHLERLIEDLHFNDSTLVTAPCNSPEQVPITFGCAHTQQLIWQLFNAIEKGFAAAGDTDTEFLDSVLAKRDQMDKGVRIGWWGQLQEWKVDMDSPIDTHRHLSHLIGLYPGYAITSYDPALQGGLIVNRTFVNYTKEQVLNAAEKSLLHRGNGTGPDADAGWDKLWRAAAWAQLGNESEFYKELTYAIESNFAANLFDLYTTDSCFFQIDANFGYPAAVLNGLLQAPDVANIDMPLQVTLLPALPPTWSTGEMKGARIRGGITLDFAWSGGKLTSATFTVDDNVAGRERDVVVNYGGQVIGQFRSNEGTVVNLSF